MCGIAGIAGKLAPDGTASLQVATEALAHRGPGGPRLWQSPTAPVTLGHCRLSILDPQPRAAGPFHYAGRYTLLYNGELYNYRELRAALQGLGRSFTTESDTEVVAAAWAAWGPGALSRFDGAYAFALWDEEAGELHAARDPFGEKPFHFHWSEGTLRFASEPKGLWPLGVPRTVKRQALYNFLTIGYTTDPTDRTSTVWEGVLQLPPGGRLHFRPGTGAPEVLYAGPPIPADTLSISEAEAAEELRRLLTESVDRRLRSDVPVGTSLSGGLDSSCIAALCAGRGGTFTHRAFTAVFPGFERNEGAAAAATARLLGLGHHPVHIGEGDVAGLMDEVACAVEAPFSSASPLAQRAVFRAARSAGVTVLLDGQGADELLGGYTRFHRWAALEGSPLKRKLYPLGAALHQTRKMRKAGRTPWLSEAFREAHRKNLPYTLPLAPTLNSALWHSTYGPGLEELLHLADRNSMAESVEVRLPFLSRDLADFLFRLPGHYKIRDGWTKWLLRKAAAPLLPQEIAWNKAKVALEPPQAEWMQLAPVQDRMHAARQVLIREGILHPSEAKRPLHPEGAYSGGRAWSVWSAAQLFQRVASSE